MRRTRGENYFNAFNLVFLGLVSLTCIVPILTTLSISFSDPLPVNRNEVTFWPIGFNLKAYEFLLANTRFWRGVSDSP